MDNLHKTILVVEDSPEDFEATTHAFRKTGPMPDIQHCWTGVQALDYLYRRGAYEDPASSPRPAFVLLDLNLPGIDGREVLDTLKRDQTLKTIPVVVFSSSLSDDDIDGCYRRGANSYIGKPLDMNKFVGAIKAVREFWLEFAVVPSAGPLE